MARIGIYRIGFVEQNEVTDSWQEEEQQRNGNDPLNITSIHWFIGLEQDTTTLTEESVDDDGGLCFDATLTFTVRKDQDIALAKKYIARPVVIHAIAVDGNDYKLGTKEYPVRMNSINRYNALETREIEIDITYRTLTGILQ